MRSIFTDQQVFISSRKATKKKKKIKGGKRFSFYFASSWDAFMICYQPKYNHYLNKTEKEKASALSPGTFSYIFKIRRNILKFQSREPFLVNDASARGGTFANIVCQWVVDGERGIKYQFNQPRLGSETFLCGNGMYTGDCIPHDTNETQFVVSCRKCSPRIIRPCWQALSFVVLGAVGWLGSSTWFVKKNGTFTSVSKFVLSVGR